MKSLLSNYIDFMACFFKGLTRPKRILFILLNTFLSLYIVTVTFLVYSEIHIVTAFIFLVYTFVVFNVLVYLCHYFKDKQILVNVIKSKINIKTVFFCCVLSFIILFLTYLAYYPGGISPDNVSQWKQVQSFKFDNWHPVFHTFLIYLLTKVINSYGFIILIQIILFSLALGYLIATLEAWGLSRKVLIVMEIYILLNSFTRNILMYAWKDVAMTILIMFIITQLVNIYFSDGKWLCKYRNVFILSLLIAFITLVRHNGFFYTLPLVGLIVFTYFKKEKKVLLLLLSSVFIYLAVTGPMYTLLKVTYPDNTFTESVGIPMTILGDVMKKNKDGLSDETRAFLEDIAPKEDWEEVYVCGDYNSIKFVSKHEEVLKRVTVEEFLDMTLDTIKRDPVNSFLAIRELTGIVWKVHGEGARISVHTNGEEMGYTYADTKYNILGKFFTRILDTAINVPVMDMLFALIGVQMLVLMLFGLLSVYKNGIKPLMFVVPNVCYNLGTMLLLCGKDYRFFHFNVVVTIVACFVLISKQGAFEGGRND